MSDASFYRWMFACAAIIIHQLWLPAIGISQIVIDGHVLRPLNTVRQSYHPVPVHQRSPSTSVVLRETLTPTKSKGEISFETTPEPPKISHLARTNDSKLEPLIEIEKRIRQLIPVVTRCVVAVEGGTGVIISRDGYILTASHIAKEAGRAMEVRLPDGRTQMATSLGTNYNTDTGLVRLDSPGPWPFVEFDQARDSQLVKCQPGDWCVTLGYPLSFPRGKPAAIRVGRILETSEGQLVTDCPIMGGDSGGPLFDLEGNLIGINSRVKHDVAANLHIPIQTFQDEWDKLAESIEVRKTSDPNKPVRAFLGVLGETDQNRVRVRRVQHGSPAAMAGWQAEDVILQFGGQPVGTFDEVVNILADSQPGAIVVAKLNRYGNVIDLPVRLGKH